MTTSVVGFQPFVTMSVLIRLPINFWLRYTPRGHARTRARVCVHVANVYRRLRMVSISQWRIIFYSEMPPRYAFSGMRVSVCVCVFVCAYGELPANQRTNQTARQPIG